MNGWGQLINALGTAATETVASGSSDSGSFWMPPQASTGAAGHDALFYFILILCTIFFVGIVGSMIYFVIRYKRRSDDQKTHPIQGSHKIEIIWSVVPTILLMVIFAWGFRDFMDSSIPPANAMEIRATGSQWSWQFDYPNSGGCFSNELTVPIDTPVKLTMSSTDVLHSLFIPAFRVKRDVLPERYTVLWFEATVEGDFDLFCTEYCGQQHSTMLSTVHVVSQESFDNWIQSVCVAGLSRQVVFEASPCPSCHSVAEGGGDGLGPNLFGIYNTERAMDDGESVLADDNYLRESIMDPNAHVRLGFEAGRMPTFRGQLSETQINLLIDYVKSLGAEGTDE